LSTAESQFFLSIMHDNIFFLRKKLVFFLLHTKNWKIKHWYVFYCICKGYSHSGSKLLSIIVGGVSWFFQLFVYNLISVWMSFGRDDDDNENKQHSNQLHIKHLASYSLLQKVVIGFLLQKRKKKEIFATRKRRKKKLWENSWSNQRCWAKLTKIVRVGSQKNEKKFCQQKSLKNFFLFLHFFSLFDFQPEVDCIVCCVFLYFL